MRRGDAYAGVLIRLPETEDGPGGILHNSHAAGLEIIKRRREEFATELLGAGGCGVSAFDGNVEIPMRRNAVGELFGTKSPARRSVAAFHLKSRVEDAG